MRKTQHSVMNILCTKDHSNSKDLDEAAYAARGYDSPVLVSCY